LSTGEATAIVTYIDHLEAENVKLKDETQYAIRECRADEWQEGEEWKLYPANSIWHDSCPISAEGGCDMDECILVRKRRTPSVREQLAERIVGSVRRWFHDVEMDDRGCFKLPDRWGDAMTEAIVGDELEHFDVTPKEEQS
jgi:hypothetical protein